MNWDEEIDFIARPVASLQSMLREIAYTHASITLLTIDGIFGSETQLAVTQFQTVWGLAPTGAADNDTWDSVTTAYHQVLAHTAPPAPLAGFPGQGYSIRAGQRCVHMVLIQAMFRALGAVLSGIEDAPVTGEHVAASVRNVIWLQRCSGQLETGAVERITWEMLARLYATTVTRGDAQLAAACPSCPIPSAPSNGNVRGFPWEPFAGGVAARG